jgi:hypothetical protein
VYFKISLMAAAAFAASAQAAAKPVPTGRQLNQTSWAYVEDGRALRMSIDAHGNYIEETLGGKVTGQGTAVMKGTKDCFTPFMSKDREHCWTSKPLTIGQSMLSVSDKGERLKVTRIKYIPMKMRS